MKRTVTGRHLTILAPRRRRIEARLLRVERLLGPMAVSAQCVLSEERGAYRCELTVHVRGSHVFAGLGRDPGVDKAVGLAIDKVMAQALKLKDRWQTRRRRPEQTRRGA